MNIIAVDDEYAALWTLEKAIRQEAPQSSVACFENAGAALEYAAQTPVDVAFLDIELSAMNGLALAKHLKDIRGETNIIFVTGYRDYMSGAFAMHASGYVMKPVSPKRVAEELANLRSPVAPPGEGVRVQCFGNFEVFVNSAPVAFSRPKSKEILAYLVDRKGAFVGKKDLAAVLWEQEVYTHNMQSHLHVLLADMKHTLREAGAGDIVIHRRGQYAVDASRFVCDYYSYDKGDAAAVNSYHGEYMANYSWAEFTAGRLTGHI